MTERTHVATSRGQWITWILAAVAAVLAGIAAGRPITLPPLPIEQHPPQVEPQPPINPPTIEPDPLGAIVRTSRPGVGCSATLIGPRRPDNRWWVLTAAHCCDRIGERWSMRFRDGRSAGFTIVNIDRRSDCAWGVTDSNDVIYPHALLAERSPEIGAKVWHAGYGVDVPGNREEGAVLAVPDASGQLKFRLSVSSGDSGGGIVIDAGGRVCSTVCCTTRRGAVADVWGASTEAIRAAQRDTVDIERWDPIEVPERMPEK
jgi:hypothetical protein